MEVAVIYIYGTPKPGCFKQAAQASAETVPLFETLKQEGKISSYEFYGLGSGDPDVMTGITIVKGPAESVYELQFDERVASLSARTALAVSHFSTHFALFGEALAERVVANRKLMEEIDLIPVG